MKDEQIEDVARKICLALDLDPMEQCGHGYTATMTPQELTGLTSGVIPMTMHHSPRWMLYRHQAANAIAVKMATEDAA